MFTKRHKCIATPISDRNTSYGKSYVRLKGQKRDMRNTLTQCLGCVRLSNDKFEIHEPKSSWK